jgi:hypothetical protein
MTEVVDNRPSYCKNKTGAQYAAPLGRHASHHYHQAPAAMRLRCRASLIRVRTLDLSVRCDARVTEFHGSSSADGSRHHLVMVNERTTPAFHKNRRFRFFMRTGQSGPKIGRRKCMKGVTGQNHLGLDPAVSIRSGATSLSFDSGHCRTDVPRPSSAFGGPALSTRSFNGGEPFS